nr:hypothetical protein [Paenibacillus tianmuensis]
MPKEKPTSSSSISRKTSSTSTAESLGEESKKRLESLLNYSPLLRSVWEWKEAFTTWYDCSPNLAIARLGFYRGRRGTLV